MTKECDLDDLQRMNSIELIDFFKNIINNGECDGSCDEISPYITCDICEAKYVLNRMYDDLYYVYAGIVKNELSRYRNIE